MSRKTTENGMLRLALPKGRMQDRVLTLLADAGIRVTPTARGYRPVVSLADCEAKVLKHQNIVEMLELGSRDVGFAGADWVEELRVDIVELLNTGLDPVSVVAAAPAGLFDRLDKIGRPLVVASEYENLTRAWITRRGLDAEFVRSFGATEVFPPEDADVIVDNTATGSTLRANDLEIVDTVITSSTRLYASPQAMEDDVKRDRIENLRLLLTSVLEARKRVMIEVNASEDRLNAIVSLLPCMREATVAPLYGGNGFAVRAAVLRDKLPEIVPAIKAAGATDVVVTSISQIVP
jgi:ATP phosphoribosyltransferase